MFRHSDVITYPCARLPVFAWILSIYSTLGEILYLSKDDPVEFENLSKDKMKGKYDGSFMMDPLIETCNLLTRLFFIIWTL